MSRDGPDKPRSVAACAQDLRALVGSVLEAQETERAVIVRELHGEVGQVLAILKMNLRTLATVPGEAATVVTESLALVDRTLQRVRDLSLALRPSLLDDFGFVITLRWYLERQAAQAGWQSSFETDGADTRAPAAVEAACFRIAEEALANVARHARARRVRVSVQRTATETRLVVQDDGCGFDVHAERARAVRDGLTGLRLMTERATLVGGRLAVESALGRGSAVRVSVPHTPRPPVAEEL